MPDELGGGGLDAVAMTLVERELGRASYALQWLVARPSNILLACEGEQRERYLLPPIRGERHDCLAMSEPGAGSDVRVDDAPERVRDGDDYVINGTKHFISNADMADFVDPVRRDGHRGDGQGSPCPDQLACWWISDTPGLTVQRDRRASRTVATTTASSPSRTAAYRHPSGSARKDTASS